MPMTQFVPQVTRRSRRASKPNGKYLVDEFLASDHEDEEEAERTLSDAEYTSEDGYVAGVTSRIIEAQADHDRARAQAEEH